MPTAAYGNPLLLILQDQTECPHHHHHSPSPPWQLPRPRRGDQGVCLCRARDTLLTWPQPRTSLTFQNQHGDRSAPVPLRAQGLRNHNHPPGLPQVPHGPPGPQAGGGEVGGGVEGGSPQLPLRPGAGVHRAPSAEASPGPGRGLGCGRPGGRGRLAARSRGPAAASRPRRPGQAWPHTKAAPTRAGPRHASTHRAAPRRLPGAGTQRSAATARGRPTGVGGGPGSLGGGAGWRKPRARKGLPVRPKGRIGPAAAVWGQGLSPPAGQGVGRTPPLTAGQIRAGRTASCGKAALG